MLRVLLLLLAVLACTGEASALTIEWICNPEPDMKEYRVDYSTDAGKTWGVEGTIPHPKPCVSPVKMGVTRYLTPGEKLFRVVSIDLANNAAEPSQPVSYTVPASTSGQEEADVPPVPVVILPPPPPPVPKPEAIKKFAVKAGTAYGSAIISLVGPDDGTGRAASINVRTGPSPSGWGTSLNLTCPTFPCTVTGLPTGTPQDFQAIPFRVTDKGSVFGEFAPVVTPTLPAPPVYTLKDALAAASKACQALKTCTAKDLAKKLDAELKKVNP